MIASMINHLTSAALRFKWITLALVVLALVTGVLALTQLNQELVPSMEFPANIVLAPNSGATAEQMRDQVTIPIEKAVRAIHGVVNVQSTTTDGLTDAVIMNEFGLDQEAFRGELRRAVESIAYPAGMKPPHMLTFGVNDLPLVYAGVSADRPLPELKALIESDVVPTLKKVPGIADVQVTGGQELPAVTAESRQSAAQPTPAFGDAILGVLISIIAVYFVMVITFRSLVHPFIILFSLPMAAIGAGIALWLTNGVVGLPVLVGLMMLVGIVVTNAIVLIDRVNTNRKERGMNTPDALVEGGRIRLRPILMTAVATILALVPLAVSAGGGAIIASDLAKVVIGGLLTSTLLTLVVVPVVYSLLDRGPAVMRRKSESAPPG